MLRRTFEPHPSAMRNAVISPAGRPEDDLDIPDYLTDTYTWCYLNPKTVPWLDSQWVVQTILWGNADRLADRALDEFSPGQHLLQPAHAYGSIVRKLADLVGPAGRLDVADVAPVQIERCRAKLGGYANVSIRRADAAVPPPHVYDGICCFFLLHEVPDSYKRRIVNGLLGAVKEGGKVVFVDYHRCHRLHPLRPIMGAVFRFLEPFAASLCRSEIRNYALAPEAFSWRKETYFGGLYQKVVAESVAVDNITNRGPGPEPLAPG